MANPEDFRLAYTPSGLPVLEGPESPSALSSQEVKKRLSDLLAEKGSRRADPEARRSVPTTPRGRPQPLATPAFPAPALPPVRPIPQALQPAVESVVGKTMQQAARVAPASLRAPVASEILKDTPLMGTRPPPSISEEEFTRVLGETPEREEKELTEAQKRFAYYSSAKTPPKEWNPTPVETKSLLDEGYITPQALTFKDSRERIWAGLRAQQAKPYQVPERLLALDEVQRRALAPMEKEARKRLFKHGMTFSQMGSSIDWFRTLETLQKEYRILLNEERLDAGKKSIELTSEQEIAEFNDTVLFRAAQTLQDVAGASGLSVSSVHNPEIMEDINWYWSGLQPYRAMFSPVTFFEPTPTGIAASPEEAVFNVGEARYIPQAQEAYGNLQKFGMLASVVFSPIAAMMESGESWSDDKTLAVIMEGRADPFDHLEKFGYLLTGDEDSRFNKVVGTGVLTVGLLIEPEPFTSILSLVGATRKAVTYAARQYGLSKPAKILAKQHELLESGRITRGQFFEALDEAGEKALKEYLQTIGQQAIGVKGSRLSAFRKFSDFRETLAEKAVNSQRKLVELSGEAVEAVDEVALRLAKLQAAEDAANLAYVEMKMSRAELDATLELRGFTPEEAAKIDDPKSLKAKGSAETRMEALYVKRSAALEKEVNKRQKAYETAQRAVNEKNTRVTELLSDILGSEVPIVGRTPGGRVSSRWYPIVETDAAGGARLAETLPTARGEDIVAIKKDGKWVKPEGINPNRVYGGRGGPLTVEDVSVGTSSQKFKNAGTNTLPASSKQKFELWIDVRDVAGNQYRIRHPISRSNWAKRPDARALQREGFGINLDQAKQLRDAAEGRRTKFTEMKPIKAEYQVAIDRRKTFKVLQEEAAEGVSAGRRIKAWRNARNRFASRDKTRKEAAKLSGKAGTKARGARVRIQKQVEDFANKEAKVAAAAAQDEVLLSASKKLSKGLTGLQKLLKQRTGGVVGSALKRGLNDILDYKRLRPEEVEKAVENIVTKAIKDTTEGAGVINSSKFKQRLLSEYLKAPGATDELSEAALDLLKAKSPTAKKVLEAAEGAKPVALTADEIAGLQDDVNEFVSKMWKQRASSGPLSYAVVFEREKDYYLRLPAEGMWDWISKVFPRVGVTRTGARTPSMIARSIKMRELGIVDEELADVIIASSNLYDLAIDELLATTKFGKMGEESAIENMKKLMDNEEKLVLRTTDTPLTGKPLVSETTQQFDRLIGADSRFTAARASLLDDLRVVPLRGMTEETLYKEAQKIADELGIPVDEVDLSLVRRSLEMDGSDQTAQALQTLAFAFYPPARNVEAGMGAVLTYRALKILRGKKAADGTFKGGATTFREFSRKMISATHDSVGSWDESARAYAMASTGISGAAVNGYAKGLAAKITYAPLSPDQVLAVNRLLVGNPHSKADAAKSGYEAYSLTEDQIDAGIEALAQLGLPLSERGVRNWTHSVKLRTEVSKTVKELVKVGSDPSANPYMIRGLLDQLDSLTEGSTKKLLGYNPLDPEMGIGARGLIGTRNAYDALSAAWRTSLTTGILYPNPAYWANNVMGDFSQMWLEVGLRRSAQLSFNNFMNNVPVWGRGLAERQAQMQAWAVKKGADALPSPLEVFANPYLGKLLKGEDFVVVAKNGRRIRGKDLMREAIEDGIYATQVNQELYTLFKNELSKQSWTKSLKGTAKDLLKGDVRSAQLIADHANLVQQRQRMALYADFRMRGFSRQVARDRTLAALYDWKDGVSALEINSFVRLSPFYRFWKLGMRQMVGAFLDPVAKPVTSQLLKSLKGQTKIARTKQQILLFGGMPEIFGETNMEDANSEASMMADFYAFRYPEYLDSKIIGTFSAMPSDKNWRDWYIREAGRDYDSIARIWPTATILDLASLLSSFLQSSYHVSTTLPLGIGEKLEGAFGKPPEGWKSKAAEPWVQQLNPIVQDWTRSILDGAGITTEYYSKSGQIRLNLGSEPLLLTADQALGLIGLGLPLAKDRKGKPTRDKSGAYTMNKTAYRLLELLTAPVGLLTQAPRYIKAAKNPAWEDSYRAGVAWMLQSILRVGAPTPYSGKRMVERAMRRGEEALAGRETAGITEQREDPRDPSLR